eukprot:UN00003
MHLNNALIALPILSLRSYSQFTESFPEKFLLTESLRELGTLEELCALLLTKGPLG